MTLVMWQGILVAPPPVDAEPGGGGFGAEMGEAFLARYKHDYSGRYRAGELPGYTGHHAGRYSAGYKGRQKAGYRSTLRKRK